MTRERWCAAAIAVARTAVCGYRAATQSLTHDEAFTYLNFLDAPWSKLWGLFDAANHVLYSAAAKVSIAVLGVSELSLRLPSVLAGLALLLGVFALLEDVQSRALRWLAYLALALHPLLLDFSVAARGYGMGLALLVWAIRAATHQRAAWAGVLLGLGVSANLTVAFPALALMVSRRNWRSALRIALPAFALVAAICGPTLRYATRAHFYTGYDTVWDSTFDLVHTSLRGSPDLSTYVARWALPGIVALWIAAGAVAWRRIPHERLTVPLTLAITVAGVLAAHMLLGVRLPMDRTGLYLVLLAGISWAVLADNAAWLRAGSMIAAGLLLAQFVTQFQMRDFRVWWYNAATRDAALVLERETRGQPPESVSVGATFLQQPVLEFYRRERGMAALKPIERQAPTPLSGYDYFVLSAPDTDRPEARRLRTIYAEPRSGILVAISKK